MNRNTCGKKRFRSSNRGSVVNDHRAIQRITERKPYQSSCPNNPPCLSLGYSLSKYVPVTILFGPSGFYYGSPTAVPVLKTNTIDNNNVVVKLTRYDVFLLIMHQLYGTHLSLDVILFVHVSLKKVRLWGPNTNDSSATVSLSLHEPADIPLTELQDASPVYVDSGTPFRRPRVSVSSPSPRWYIYDEEVAQKDVLVTALIDSGQENKDSDHLGLFHVLISISLGTTQ